MAVSVVSFSFSRAAQPEHWNPLCWVLAFLSTLVYLRLHCTACPPYRLSAFCSIRRPYITFKLPRGDMDPPPRLRNFFQYLATGMCHFRYLWNGLCDRHRAEITVMQFRGHSLSVRQSMRVLWDFLKTRPISSANFRPRDFLSKLPLECVTSVRCITLNGIFGRVNRSKHNTGSDGNDGVLELER